MTDEEDIKAAQRLNRALRRARMAIDPNVPSQMLQAFLEVGLNEGKTLSELAEGLGTNLSTASRQLLDLGERNRKLEAGYGLVERKQDPMNLRVNRYCLTPKGKLLMKELTATMKE